MDEWKGELMQSTWPVRTTVLITALSMVFFGVWARWDPAGFANHAGWPNHIHFLHDAGVFQIGIGLTLLATLIWKDAIAVGLGGFSLTNSLHALNHAQDLHLGGNPSDPWLLFALSIVGLIGLGLRIRQLRNPTMATETDGRRS
jgi:hypothetical protein